MRLRNIRIVIQLISLTLITLLLFGIGTESFGWMAKIQFVPSVLRVIGSATILNIAVLAVLFIITWLVGRIYCSVICPLGMFQDFISWIRRQGGLYLLKLQGKKYKQHSVQHPKLRPFLNHFKYKKENKTVRLLFLGVYTAAVASGIQIVISFLAPYATYARFISAILGNSKPIVAIVSFSIIFFCSWFGGRWWCNTVCPVGTLLGAVSRHSLFSPAIDKNKCTDCGRCERSCKSSCIDAKNHTIDTSRCVDCFDCLVRCKEGAISFKAAPSAQQPDPGRRKFLILSGIALASGVKASAKGKLTSIVSNQHPERKRELVPPGSKSFKHFHKNCIACGLCITSCPHRVLRPSTNLDTFMQPQMSFEKGFCSPECTTCSEVCPTGAIERITSEQKAKIKIGTARIDRSLCIINTRGRGCGKCASICPSGAIRMVEIEGKKQPVIMEEECIGCGKCEYLCPARPIRAITVEGIL